MLPTPAERYSSRAAAPWSLPSRWSAAIRWVTSIHLRCRRHCRDHRPAVPNGGSVQLRAASTFPRLGIDLPDIAFGAQTTLAYSQNPTGAGGTLTVSDGRHRGVRAPRQLYRRKLCRRGRRPWGHADHGSEPATAAAAVDASAPRLRLTLSRTSADQAKGQARRR